MLDMETHFRRPEQTLEKDGTETFGHSRTPSEKLYHHNC